MVVATLNPKNLWWLSYVLHDYTSKTKLGKHTPKAYCKVSHAFSTVIANWTTYLFLLQLET